MNAILILKWQNWRIFLIEISWFGHFLSCELKYWHLWIMALISVYRSRYFSQPSLFAFEVPNFRSQGVTNWYSLKVINDRRIDPSSALKYYCRIILSASEAVRLGRRDDEPKSPFPPKSESEEFLACLYHIHKVCFLSYFCRNSNLKKGRNKNSYSITYIYKRSENVCRLHLCLSGNFCPDKFGSFLPHKTFYFTLFSSLIVFGITHKVTLQKQIRNFYELKQRNLSLTFQSFGNKSNQVPF